MNSSIISFISRQSETISKLSSNDLETITDFMWAWSYFEGHYLKRNANINTIKDFVNKYELNGASLSKLNYVVEYFISRYINDKNSKRNYSGLRLYLHRDIKEVEYMLNRSDCNDVRLKGCLMIIYRYRNNLFHGEKWFGEISDQINNFKVSNILLRSLME